MTATFDKPTRQSSFAIIFILGRIFRILLKQLWVVILILLFNPKKQIFNSFTFFLIGMAALGAVSSVLSYFRLYFYVKDGELILEKGILRRKKVAVPLDRIQTVNFKQGLLHQALNVISIDIDTAGSVGKEFSLEALKKEDAEALRSVIEAARPATAPVTEAGQSASKQSGTEAARPARLVFQLSPLDLLKIGVSQNHFRTAGIIMVFFLSFFDDLEDALDINVTEKFDEWLGLAEEADIFYYLLIGVPFFFLVSFFITLFRTIFQYFNLRFWRTDQGFKMDSGLFTKQEISANLNKIQFVRWDNSPLKRLFGMISIRLPQAASVQVTRRLSAHVPGCYEEFLAPIRAAYFPTEFNYPKTEHGVHWRLVYRLFFLHGFLPVAFLILLSWSWLGPSVWIWLLWLPFGLWLSFLHYRNWRWSVNEEGMRTTWGVLNQHSVLLQWYKVQAISIRQSYFLRRRGLANINLYTAAGAVRIPYIPIEKALELQDFVLYKVETDKRKWM